MKTVRLIDAGTPEQMQSAFRAGNVDYIHLQAPASHQLEAEGAGSIVASVGESMPPVAFSSLCCSRDFLRTDACTRFLEAFRQAREWVRSAPAEEIAQTQASYFPDCPGRVLAAAITRYQKVATGRVAWLSPGTCTSRLSTCSNPPAKSAPGILTRKSARLRRPSHRSRDRLRA